MFTRITASGLKTSPPIDFVPAGINVITGPNASGKTVYKHLLFLLWLDYDPAIGKKNTFSTLAGGDSIDIAAEVDGKPCISARWFQNGQSVKHERQCSIETPPTLLDLNVFKTQQDQLTYILQQVDTSKAVSKADVIACIKNAYTETASAETEQAISNAVAIAEAQEGDTVQEWLENVLSALSDEVKGINRAIKDLKGFERVKIEAAAQMPDATPQDILAETTRRHLQAQASGREWVAAAREQSERAAVAYNEIKSQNAGVLRIEHRLSQISGLLQGFDEAALKAELEVLQATIENLSALIAADEGSQLERRHRELSVTLSDRQGEYSAARREVQQVDADMNLFCQRREMELQQNCCPYCGTDAEKLPDWQSTIVAKLDEEEAGITARRKAAADQLSKTSQAVSEVEAQLKAVSDAVEVLHDNRSKLNSAYARQSKLQGQLSSVASTLAEQKELQARLNEFPLGDELARQLAEADAARREALDALQRADEAYRKDVQEQQREIESLEASIKHDALEIESKVLTAIGKALKVLQKEVIGKIFDPFLEHINKFTDGFLPAPVKFHNDEIGYWRDGKFVVKGGMSGAERAMTDIGLAISMSQNAPVKFAVIDEFAGPFSPRKDERINRHKVLERMKELCETNVLDHVFLIDSDQDFWKPYEKKNWLQIIRVA